MHRIGTCIVIGIINRTSFARSSPDGHPHRPCPHPSSNACLLARVEPPPFPAPLEFPPLPYPGQPRRPCRHLIVTRGFVGSAGTVALLRACPVYPRRQRLETCMCRRLHARCLASKVFGVCQSRRRSQDLRGRVGVLAVERLQGLQP